MDMQRHAAGAEADPDLSGRTLGGYRLVRRLGSGGMADVYLAEQVSLGRQVAVKVLRPETLRHRGAVERFEREARAAAALVHGNIVQIHEVARIEGVHFLAEEYVAGPSLKAWLAARGPLDERQAVAVLGQVGEALARAAGQGIVHRDIKPENLLVTPAGEVKVADFGLARVLADDVELTQSGTTLGTPLYMSPEQAQGHDVDCRSDLYSLGATIYHLLAGRPPFTGPSGVSVAMAHVTQPPEPLARLRPDLSSELCALIERLLAKDPAARFGDAIALLHALEDVPAAPGTTSRRGASPLAWEGTGAEWREEAAGATGGTSGGGSTRAPTSPRMQTATAHLQAVLERETRQRRQARRVWVATALAALAAALVGFVLGRLRPRRSELFGRDRRGG